MQNSYVLENGAGPTATELNVALGISSGLLLCLLARVAVQRWKRRRSAQP